MLLNIKIENNGRELVFTNISFQVTSIQLIFYVIVVVYNMENNRTIHFILKKKL